MSCMPLAVVPQKFQALQGSVDSVIVPGNTPAKPMWTSLLTLKSRGFFIACRLTNFAPQHAARRLTWH